jgi:hypothetical protein
MSPWADCPIVEVRADGRDVFALVPPFRGDRATAAVANTLAAVVAMTEGRPGNVWPRFDPAVSDDQADIAVTAGSVFYRHHKARRGMVCKKCGHPT